MESLLSFAVAFQVVAYVVLGVGVASLLTVDLDHFPYAPVSPWRVVALGLVWPFLLVLGLLYFVLEIQYMITRRRRRRGVRSIDDGNGSSRA
jgi:hypothetical protein